MNKVDYMLSQLDRVSNQTSHIHEIMPQNFAGIKGMLGTPSTLTEQLHNTFNQIHYNERVMRKISLAIT